MTTAEGTTADFRLESDISSIIIATSAPVPGMVFGGPTTTVLVIIQTDNVALEMDENFTLSFEVISQIPDGLFTGDSVLIVNELQVVIVDQSGV